MRASKFTFKKTTKVVTEHKGICLDLTEEEAHLLYDLTRFAQWNTLYKPLAENIRTLLGRELGK